MAGLLAESSRRILVTGANKGIGFAIAKRLLQETDFFVIIGSRDKQRGELAVRSLVDSCTEWENRVIPLVIDVSDDNSVNLAAQTVLETFGPRPLYGLVNNAGVGWGLEKNVVLATNLYGPRRVNDAFIPLLGSPQGRIVFVSSASGPMFVEKCNPDLQTLFLKKDITWTEIENIISTCDAVDDSSIYGLSKACLNAYMHIVSREFPDLCINACTPGFIDTDLTRAFDLPNKKSPYEGTHSTFFLLFGNPDGSGKFYGSDCLRSPLHKYRGPGEPAYTGE
jgi:NAD(P)-dependent dehydrogenase (short-subunit alcohol dehydrogenase family)